MATDPWNVCNFYSHFDAWDDSCTSNESWRGPSAEEKASSIIFRYWDTLYFALIMLYQGLIVISYFWNTVHLKMVCLEDAMGRGKLEKLISMVIKKENWHFYKQTFCLLRKSSSSVLQTAHSLRTAGHFKFASSISKISSGEKSLWI